MNTIIKFHPVYDIMFFFVLPASVRAKAAVALVVEDIAALRLVARAKTEAMFFYDRFRWGPPPRR